MVSAYSALDTSATVALGFFPQIEARTLVSGATGIPIGNWKSVPDQPVEQTWRSSPPIRGRWLW